MTASPIVIADGIPTSADLTAIAGIPLELNDSSISTGPDVLAEEDFVRHLDELATVAAEPITEDGQRVEYRMLNGVRAPKRRRISPDLSLRYELTAMIGRPLGWEAAKTLGHVHVQPPGSLLGYAEVVEVLHGEAGFLIQDLETGPERPAQPARLARPRPRRATGSSCLPTWPT